MSAGSGSSVDTKTPLSAGVGIPVAQAVTPPVLSFQASGWTSMSACQVSTIAVAVWLAGSELIARDPRASDRRH
jgi:hypothetical protein